MPSYRYLREIKPEDLQDPAGPPRAYTRRERAANWLRYHWVWLAAGAVVLGLAAYFVVDIATRVTPDVRVAVVTQEYLPDAVVTGLGEQLSAYTADVNGDGRQVVEVEVYQFSLEDEAAASGSTSGGAAAAGGMTAEDPYQQMAGITKLSAALQGGDPALILVEPDMLEGLQERFGLLGAPDGTAATGTAEEATLALGDLAAYGSLSLPVEGMDGSVLDGAELVADYRFGLVPLPQGEGRSAEKRAGYWQNARALLDNLQAGQAVS